MEKIKTNSYIKIQVFIQMKQILYILVIIIWKW